MSVLVWVREMGPPTTDYGRMINAFRSRPSRLDMLRMLGKHFNLYLLGGQVQGIPFGAEDAAARASVFSPLLSPPGTVVGKNDRGPLTVHWTVKAWRRSFEGGGTGWPDSVEDSPSPGFPGQTQTFRWRKPVCC